MLHIVAIMGTERTGKDTFASMCQEFLSANKVLSTTLSTIDPVRRLLDSAGIDVSAKTDADRKLLSDVGRALEQHPMWRSVQTLDAAEQALGVFARKVRVAFVQVREHVVVDNMRTIAQRGSQVLVHRIRIRRAARLDGRSVEATTGVASDDELRNEVDLSRYDVVVDNDADLTALEAEAAKAMLLLGIVNTVW